MKRIVASVGLVALGTSGLQAAPVSSLTSETAKPWSASLTLRGFYDDNINSAPNNMPVGVTDASGAFHHYYRSSSGFEVSPSLQFAWSPSEQTTFSAGYTYYFKYYDNQPVGNTDRYDQDHTFNVALDHSFSENYQLSLRDSFVEGQEPDFLRTGNTFATFTRTSGDNYRNFGSLNLDGQLTRLVGFEVGYANSLYVYDNRAILLDTVGNWAEASTAGILNRMEHVVHLDGRIKLQPETIGVLGYQFEDEDFTGNQQITPNSPAFPSGLMSSVRNSYGHYGYAGVDHTFRPDLTASVRVGARYTDYYNNQPSATDSIDPYAQVSLRWVYAVESSIELGFTHDRAATDLVGGNTSGTVTLDSESSVLYASLNHRLAPNLYGGLTGEFQDSVYNGGDYNSKSDRFYTFGANLEYRFNRNFSTHLGYNYDKLESDIANRSFDRNRVYLGLTASY